MIASKNDHLTAQEAVAQAWASIDGHLERFLYERENPDATAEGYEGRYLGYMAEAQELIERIEARGYKLVEVGNDGLDHDPA